MRVLFTTWSWPSHLYALVPLAWACRAAGHEVLVASQPGLTARTVGCGLNAVEVGRDVDTVGMVRGYLLPTAASPAARPSGRTAGPRAAEMFLAHADSMTDDLVRVARTWQPDIVVHEPTTWAGPIAAAAAGVPAVRHLYGTDLLLRARAVLPDLLAPLAERNGVGDVDPFGTVTIDPVPQSMQPGSAPWRLPVQYVPFNGPGHPPAVPPPSGRPRVCVTWGHTLARLDPKRFLLPAVVDALAGTDAEVVAAVSAPQRELLGAVPDGVHVLVDAPLHRVLPGCDLVIGHGGAGTILTSLAHGIPLLLVPQLPDHAGHSAQVFAAGAGDVLTADEATPARLRERTGQLLDDGKRRAAARLLRAEMLAQPSPAALADDLRVLASVPVQTRHEG
ncbi:nucleotide disphospho-sugar-binding domain-containing protein [Streptomyces sp. NPDC001262]|uniref:nucleotide disphospho-sugar-binding domain-containing protein n=1 Tax=unclassified Streptomyces TaxID=2593676 RepID=UPI0036A4BE98